MSPTKIWATAEAGTAIKPKKIIIMQYQNTYYIIFQIEQM